MSTFKVGEVAIYTGADCLSYEGQECVITGALAIRTATSSNGPVTRECYATRSADGLNWFTIPRKLRRKPPADEGRTVTRWADCPWQPEKERV